MELSVDLSSLAVNEEGYLLDPSDWTPEVAHAIAADLGISLTDAHFAVLQYLRDRFAEGTPLTIRRIGKSGLVSIKEFYALFPGGPLKVSSKIAGIPKPASCV
jgi:tRNA 2-thiouridine synthesizing protein E